MQPGEPVGNYGWPCMEGFHPSPGYPPNAAVCMALGNGILPRLAYGHPKNPPPGNIISISALVVYQDLVIFGDSTLGNIYSVPRAIAGAPHESTLISDPFITLIVNNAWPVGLFELPVGIVYINFNEGTVNSLQLVGATLATPSMTPPPPFLTTERTNATWLPAIAGSPYPLIFKTTSSSCGREGCQYHFNTSLLCCGGSAAGTCRAAYLAQTVTKGAVSSVITNEGASLPPVLAVPVPPLAGTIEVNTLWTSFGGLSLTAKLAFTSAGTPACICPLAGRQYVSLASLVANPPPTSAASDGGGGSAWTGSAAFVGGVGAAGALVGAAAAVAVAVYIRRRNAADASAGAAPGGGSGDGGGDPAVADAGEEAASASAANSSDGGRASGLAPSPASAMLTRRTSALKPKPVSAGSNGADDAAAAAAAPRRTPTTAPKSAAGGGAAGTPPAASEVRV